ncbi:hypothetical protein VSP20_09215 [Myroides phaeus]|uniref:hypothetical protein n=1 Tax=Myroides phaeus TaxID=702745 RepID=UPI002DBBCEEF|nr:hypothetical protein [Myroides phaeus]MEC4117151.1 hypothetical protein [Myroides phaeus]
METIIYIKSLHRPYNQNLNSVKWVCKFVKDKNTNNKISKSEFYIEFYMYLINKLFDFYNKNPDHSLTHGIPIFDSIKKAHEGINFIPKDQRRIYISNAVSRSQTETEKSIFSTYKAASYFINLAKDKLNFIDKNNNLNSKGLSLVNFRSNDFVLSRKEKEILFISIINHDFHFFVSLLLLQKNQKKIKNLTIEELHFTFLIENFNIRHFSYTETSNEKNYSKVREHWINDLAILDKNLNIKKSFLLIIKNEGFEQLYNDVKEQVEDYYKNKILPQSKLQNKIDLFKEVYDNSPKNELGFLALHEIANQMKMGKASFQDFLSKFYEIEKNKSNIFFNNVVQAISGKNQFFIRNRPVVNIRIKKINK